MVHTARIMSASEAANAVDALYNLRDRFFNNHGIEKAGKKAQMVKSAMKDAMDLIEPLIGESCSDPKLLFLKGKCLNVEESHNQEAEDALSKAVKLDPELLDGWNALGECFWKKGDRSQAKTCFDGALKLKKNKTSLQHMSMLLRQLDCSTEVERLNNITESLEVAKEGIKLDLNDGHSWYVLGNAYLALFFAKMETVDHMQQALKAYKKAETDKTEAVNNPDLHQNRATVHEYLEDYQAAIEGYTLAGVIDPDWPQPKQSSEMLKGRAIKICDQIEKRCGYKSKKLAALTALLKTGKGEYVPVAKLKPGINGSVATKLAIVAVFTETAQSPAQTFLGMDAEGDWCAVTVYNTVPEVLKLDQVITIPEPLLMDVKLAKMPITGEDGDFMFKSIRIDNPVTLQVNGSALGEDKLVKNVITVTSTAASE